MCIYPWVEDLDKKKGKLCIWLYLLIRILSFQIKHCDTIPWNLLVIKLNDFSRIDIEKLL